MFACFHFYFPCPVLFLLLFLPTKELNWVLAFLPPAPFNLNQINSSSFGKEVRKRNNQPLDAAVSALIAFTLPSQDSDHPGLHSFPQAHQASPSRKDSAPMLMCHHTAPTPHHKAGCYCSLIDTLSVDLPWPLILDLLHTSDSPTRNLSISFLAFLTVWFVFLDTVCSTPHGPSFENTLLVIEPRGIYLAKG